MAIRQYPPQNATRARESTSSSATGALGTPTSGVEARDYYSGNYYDAADRLVASVDVGTNEGSAWDMPGSPPARSADALVTSYSYAADAVQVVTLTGSPTGGTFTLTFGGDTTSSIAYSASVSTVQSDLAALASIDSSENVVVTQAPDGGWQIRFTGSMGGTYQNQITATSFLTGGTSPTVVISTLSLGGENGNVVDTTDPDDIDTRDYYDPLGNVVQDVQDFTTGVVSASSNKTTDYTYNSVGMTSLTAVTLNGSNDVGETTEWVYGVSTSGSPASTIDSNDIVGVTEQPNPSTGLPDASLETTVTVDALGDTLTSTDPNGTTHTYIYDVLGQQTADSVTTLGSGVDGSVREISTSYTTLGNPFEVTSYASDDGGTVVNQVEDVYNGLDQLTYDYQAVSGSVNTESTPYVEYVYNDMYEGANNSRLTEMIYPDGYTVDYNYASGLDSNISRLTSISDDTGTLESYKYLGLDTIVEMDHPETDINLTYISQDDGTGVAGDQYTGLDQFGRVIEQNWYDTSTSISVVNLEYGYDDDGNVLYRSDMVNSASSELYGYDDLGQITSFGRGTLTDDDTELSSPSVSETWTYDPLGNHLVDSTGLTIAFNYDNQITSVSSGTTPTYDSDGNMTTDQNGLKYIYNAWNELVKVENASDTVLETYSYDGLGDQMTNTVSGTTTNFLYSTSGQVLEEQAYSSGYYTQRYVWNPEYVNDMISRDNDTSGTGLTPTGSSFTRVWVINDANFNVVALVTIVDSVETVVERYEYDPFGTVTILNGDYEVEGESGYNWVYEFQGGRLDTITGDTHFGARNLDPSTGTWTSEDPLGLAAGNNDIYGVEANNTYAFVDPSGMGGLTVNPLCGEDEDFNDFDWNNICGQMSITNLLPNTPQILDAQVYGGLPAPPAATPEEIINDITEVSKLVIRNLKETTEAEMNLTVPVPQKLDGKNWGLDEKGPCFHYANQMMKKLSDLNKEKKWKDVRISTEKWNPIGNQSFLKHIIVKVIITDSNGNVQTFYFDAGSTYGTVGNMGDEKTGIIQQKDYDAATQGPKAIMKKVKPI